MEVMAGGVRLWPFLCPASSPSSFFFLEDRLEGIMYYWFSAWVWTWVLPRYHCGLRR